MSAFAVLADPTRRRMLELLAVRDRSAGELVGAFELTQPAISQHLKRLKEAGLVQVRPVAQKRLYRLDPRGLQEVEDWMGQMHGFWSQNLDRLEREMGKDASRKGGRA